MLTLCKIITDCLVKNVFVCTTFFWILCESRNIFEISTRVGSSKGDFIHPYATWNTDGVVKGNTDGVVKGNTDGVGKGNTDEVGKGNAGTGNYSFQTVNPTIPLALWIVIGVVIFIIFLICIHCAMAYQMYKIRQQRERTRASGPPFATSPPSVNQEDVQTPVVCNDVPPDYTEVVVQKASAANDKDGVNHYPKVVRGKTLETPPPAYLTVAPFR